MTHKSLLANFSAYRPMAFSAKSCRDSKENSVVPASFGPAIRAVCVIPSVPGTVGRLWIRQRNQMNNLKAKGVIIK